MIAIRIYRYLVFVFAGINMLIPANTHGKLPFQEKPVVKHLMIDPAILQKSTNTVIQNVRPQTFEPAVVPDKPWEGNDVSFTQVMPDNKGGYIMYYFSMDQGQRRFLNLATSKDGIKWQKPELGIVEYNGSSKNNILIPDIFEIGDVFRYPNNNKGKYYVLLMMKDFRHYFFVSPDGLHFKQSKEPAMDYCADSQNQIFYDPNKKNYALYFRSFIYHPPNQEYYRTVSYYQTKNPTALSFSKPAPQMKRWGPSMPPAINDEIPRAMYFDYSRKENLAKDIYTPAAIPEQQQYLAFPSIYYWFDTTQSKALNDGILSLNLFYSKDGVKWQDYGTFIDNTQIPGYNQIYMGSGRIQKGNLNYHYMAAEKSTHGITTTYSCVFRTTVENDRYAALRSDSKKAVTVLPKTSINFSTVWLNFKTLQPKGSVRVLVLDAQQKIIGDSGEMSGNELNKKIKWATAIPGMFKKSAVIQIVHQFSDIYSIKYQ